MRLRTTVAAAPGSWDALVSWPAASMAFVFSLTVGVMFGLYPASRASRLEPIQALRSE